MLLLALKRQDFVQIFLLLNNRAKQSGSGTGTGAGTRFGAGTETKTFLKYEPEPDGLVNPDPILGRQERPTIKEKKSKNLSCFDKPKSQNSRNQVFSY